jgi:HK97 family phage prohead protease
MPPVAAPEGTAVRRLRAKVRATPDEGEGRFEALVSDYSQTYSIGWGFKERILPGAFAESLADHPVQPVNWEHLWSDGPIGHGSAQELDLGLIARGELYLDLDAKVQRIYRAMVEGAVTEWSIAFMCRMQDILNTDEEPMVDQIVQGDLVEYSAVYRGACPTTATLDLRTLVTIDGDGEAEVRRLRTLFAVPDKPRERKAIAVHHTATDDGAWDAGANEKNLSNDDGAAEYREEYAWVDPDADADTKAAYSFPHHFVSAEGKVGDASTVACSSGIGRLNGGSESDDWWADRSGVHTHLAAHLTDAGKEAPELKTDAAPKTRKLVPPTAERRRAESMSFGDQENLVYAALIEYLGDAADPDDDDDVDIWIWDLAADWVVWYDYPEGTLWRLSYTLDGETVTFTGEPEQVVEQTTYVPAPASDDEEGEPEGDKKAASAALLLGSRAGRELLRASQPSSSTP